MEVIDDLNFEDEPVDNSTFNANESGDDFSNNPIVSDDNWDDGSNNNLDTQNTFSEDDDIIDSLLKSRGIKDKNSINFEDDNNQIVQRNWDDLTKEEQFNILNQANNDADNLDDSELDLINRIRLSKMSIEDFMAYERQKGINFYVNSQNSQEPSYTVDAYSDDDLFLADLQTKVENITDDELLSALEAAKSNPTVFEKQIQGIRNEYKKLEEDKINREQAIAEQERQEQFNEFSNNVINSINNFNSLGDLDISMENADAEQLYDFITGTDAAGINHFYKALNDPDTLTRVAWFALHGEDVINSISNYYKNEISNISKHNQQRTNNSSVVINKSRNKIKNQSIKSIDDLSY